MGTTVEFKRPDGQTVSGYLASASKPVASVDRADVIGRHAAKLSG